MIVKMETRDTHAGFPVKKHGLLYNRGRSEREVLEVDRSYPVRLFNKCKFVL
jgi:hypothetical protein